MSIRRGIRGWRAGVALAALSGVVAGCSPGTSAPDDPTPRQSASVSPSATPTPTPTPTVEGVLADGVKPERPGALDEAPTVAGAIAVLNYFLLLVPYAQNTSDLADFAALSHPDCEFCSSVMEGVNELDRRGHHAEGGGYLLTDASVVEVDPGRWYSVDLTLREEPSRDVDKYGTQIRDYPDRSTSRVNAVVLFEGGKWSVRGVAHESVTP